MLPGDNGEPPTTCPAPHWEIPISSACQHASRLLPQRTSQVCAGRAGEALSDADGGEGGEEPRRAARRPTGRRWQRFQPNHHEFGMFAQIQSPDLCRCFSTPTINAPKQRDSEGSLGSLLFRPHRLRTLPRASNPGPPRSPSALRLTSLVPQPSPPPASRGCLRISKTGVLLKLVPASIPLRHQSHLPEPSLTGGQTSARRRCEAGDIPALPSQECAS